MNEEEEEEEEEEEGKGRMFLSYLSLPCSLNVIDFVGLCTSKKVPHWHVKVLLDWAWLIDHTCPHNRNRSIVTRYVANITNSIIINRSTTRVVCT